MEAKQVCLPLWCIGWIVAAVGSVGMTAAALRGEDYWFWWEMRHGGPGYLLAFGLASAFVASAIWGANWTRVWSIAGVASVGFGAAGYWLSPPGGYFPPIGTLFMVPLAFSWTTIVLLVLGGLRFHKGDWRAIAILATGAGLMLTYTSASRDWPGSFQAAVWCGLAIASFACALILLPGVHARQARPTATARDP